METGRVHANKAILNGEAELISELDLAIKYVRRRRARDYYLSFLFVGST